MSTIEKEFRKLNYIFIVVSIPFCSFALLLSHLLESISLVNELKNESFKIFIFGLIYLTFCGIYLKLYLNSKIERALTKFIVDSESKKSVYIGLILMFSVAAWLLYSYYQ